jgi:uncharacterized membrane protein
MNRKTATVSLALASALATALAGRSVPAAADEGAWRLVPKGTCTTIDTPLGKGSLEPIKRPS